MFGIRRAFTFSVGGAEPPYRKVVKIVFMKSGVAASFSYVGQQSGLVGCLTGRPKEDGTGLVFDFKEGARLAPCPMKYSHHIDGNVHFSEDGKALTFGRRMAFPLTQEGRIFEMTASHTEEFAAQDWSDTAQKSTILQRFPGSLPQTVQVVADWWSIESMKRMQRDFGETIGPAPTFGRSPDHQFVRYLVKPQIRELDGFVLSINAGSAPTPVGANDTTLIFLGGWQAGTDNSPKQMEFACAWFPFEERTITSNRESLALNFPRRSGRVHE